MKLRKQAGAKLALVASSLGLLAAFFALVRSQPHVTAEAPVAPAQPTGSYQDFFFPSGPSTGSAPSQGTQPSSSTPGRRPHTRTRAS